MENTKIRFLKITIVLLFLINTCSCQLEKTQMRANNWYLFEDTKAWDFAKAVRNQDTSRFESIFKEAKIPLDFEEEIFGASLLNLAVMNCKQYSVKKLLEMGADPNHANKMHGETVMHDAVGIFQDNDDTTILNYLIAYGGDPNARTKNTNYKYNTGESRNVLSVLCLNNSNQINKAKLLINSGASLEIDTTTNWNYLSGAILSQNYKLVLLFLTYDIDLNLPVFTIVNGKKLKIQEFMKEDLIDLESEEYQDKRKVIEILEKRGIEYRNTKPSDWLIKRAKQQMPDTWEDYLSKF